MPSGVLSLWRIKGSYEYPGLSFLWQWRDARGRHLQNGESRHFLEMILFHMAHLIQPALQTAVWLHKFKNLYSESVLQKLNEVLSL